MDVPDARVKLPWQPNDGAGWRSGREKKKGCQKWIPHLHTQAQTESSISRRLTVSVSPVCRGRNRRMWQKRCPAHTGAAHKWGRPLKTNDGKTTPQAILSTFASKHEAVIENGGQEEEEKDSFISHRHRCNLRLITFAGLGRGHLHCSSSDEQMGPASTTQGMPGISLAQKVTVALPVTGFLSSRSKNETQAGVSSEQGPRFISTHGSFAPFAF